MKSKYISVLLIYAMVGQAIAVEPTLLVTKAGYFNVYVDANGVPQTPVKIQHVVVIGDAPTPPPGDVPIPPPPTGLSAAVAAMSKEKIPNADEGTALAMAVNLIAMNVSSDSSVQAGLDGAVLTVGLGTGASARIDAWYAALKALPGFTFTVAGLKATLAGLNEAYSVDAAVSTALVNTVQTGYAAGKTVEEINDELTAANPNAAFDFTLILTILTALINLLKQLGIIS